MPPLRPLPPLAGSAAGLEIAAAVTCADVSTIEMMADRHIFRAAFMPASRLSRTSQCAALFLTQYHDSLSDPQKRASFVPVGDYLDEAGQSCARALFKRPLGATRVWSWRVLGS